MSRFHTRPLLTSLLSLSLPLAAAAPAAAQLATSNAQSWLQDSAGIDLTLQDDAYFGMAVAAGDFDGDGFDELAIGVPEYDVAGLEDAGLVVVLYGGPGGPGTGEIDYWDQSNGGLEDAVEENDHFGAALATGDFDGDGFADLAIGIPYETVDGATSAGAVQILFGSENGLTTSDQFLHQGWGGGLVLGTPEDLDRFGSTLVVGRFNIDKYDDLAVGAPYETVSDQSGAGAFHVLFGSAAGISTDGDKLFYKGNGIAGAPAAGENLGWSLAAGNFESLVAGDELAVGAPGTSVNGTSQAGAVWVLEDLDGATAAYALNLDSFLWPDDPGTGDGFGNALAAGQFDGDGEVDLAIGAWGKTAGGQSGAGKVYAYYFGAHAIGVFDQTLPGELPGADDYFGGKLVAGDFDGDNVADLAIGTYFENLPASDDAGVAHVLYGVGGTGLTTANAQTLLQAVDSPEAGDRFGLALAAGRFSGHSGTDLAVGAPFESGEMIPWEGAANVYFSDALFRYGFDHADPLDWSSWVGAE